MAHKVVTLRDERGVEYEVDVDASGTATIAGRTLQISYAHRGEVRVDERTIWVASDADVRWIFIDGHVHILELDASGVPLKAKSRAGTPRRTSRGARDGALTAPMPATVVKIAVAPGDRVKAGDALIILEAMKMELPVRAAGDGSVKAVRCNVGQLVQPGEELVELDSESTP